MIRTIVHGCNGKMGQVIIRLAKNDPDVQVVAGVDRNLNPIPNIPVYENLSSVQEEADVCIDFSHHSAIPDLVKTASEKKLPLVIATTGLGNDELAAIERASKVIPIFTSANMSLGINLLINLVKEATRVLADTSDIEIIEKHHNQKLDAPSGTALMIANAINKELDNQMQFVYGRNSKTQKREKNEIGILALRGGTIVGEHQVIFAGKDEILEIKHQALSRDIFGFGALKAAKFIVGKEPGLYTIKDLIEKG